VALLSDADRARFDADGYLVLRRSFDAARLSAEVDAALADGLPGAFRSEAGGGISGRYLPLMNERTPESLRLLDRFAAVAAALLARPMLPVRAKCVLYFGDAGWHRDSDTDLASVGFAAYLEPLDAASGALRVRPGSHRHTDEAPGIGGELALPTEPGDVIVFDEHLWHASSGGRDRRQWRVDFVADPTTDREVETTRDYFRAIYAPDWDGGYDVDRYPTYGPHWQSSGRAAVERLRALGVYELAAAEEAFARGRRRSRLG
jgi:hypothetical protein